MRGSKNFGQCAKFRFFMASLTGTDRQAGRLTDRQTDFYVLISEDIFRTLFLISEHVLRTLFFISEDVLRTPFFISEDVLRTPFSISEDDLRVN